ncbi:recombinase family protein [Glycomyces sp. NPDC046736]|uniref:recombinase family protein n=1 Tax=Glycomyces sp. NPDC046736 TaxID=3155615 RepID=UPI00340B1A96
MDEIPPIFQGKDALRRKVIAIYCRISVDKRGRKEGVAKQQKWGLAYAERQWPGVPVEVFSDNDLSAIDPNVIRPDFERLRVWVSQGRIAAIWVVEQFRFVRRPSEWFMVAEELTAAGIDEIHTNRDGVVIVQDEVAGIKAVLGGGEVRRLKSRVADTLKENAIQGLPPHAPPAGYRNTKVRGVRTYEIVEEEWRPRLWAAKAVLDGWSIQSAAAELRTLGVPGSHRRIIRDEDGDPIIDEETGEESWRPTIMRHGTLRQWLISPTVAGLRVFKGELIGQGNWPPLLCEDPFAEDAHAQALAMRNRLLARMKQPREVTTRAGKTFKITAAVIDQPRTRRRYLLTGGVAVCAACGHKLVAGIKSFGRGERKRSVPYYWCTTTYGGGGCVGIKADWLENHVRDRLMSYVATPEFAAAFGTDPHAAQRDVLLDELESMSIKRSKLAALWASESLGDVEWESAKAVLDEREGAIQAELLSVPPPPPDDDLDPRVLKDPRVWEHMTLGERRAVIDLVVGKVRLGKATPPYARFDSTRITIEWR